jgi:hypothetical protein
MLILERGAGSRLGSGVLIAAAHVLFVLALLHFTGARVETNSTPTDYIAFAFIPAPAKSAPDVHSAPAPVVVPATRPRPIAVLRQQPAPSEPTSIVIVPQAAVPDAPTEAAPATTGKLDMESLRIAARQVERERVPTALERLRTSEQMRARDDTRLSRAVSEAKRPDCRTKYAGGEKANLLLLIPLAIDTITDTGCKW